MRRFPKVFLIAILVLASIATAQELPQAHSVLRVEAGGHLTLLNAGDLAAIPHQSASVVDDKGNPTAYQGVPVAEILHRAGAPAGKELHGRKMAAYLLVTATDGYHAVFALAELDPDFSDRHILLADRRDGKDLSPIEGPFRIIVPGEKRHARWVRNVTSLSLKSAE